MSWPPAAPYQCAAWHSVLFSLFYFIGRAFILRYFNAKQYRNAIRYVNKANIGKCRKTLMFLMQEIQTSQLHISEIVKINYWSLQIDYVSFCSFQAFPLLKLCSGKRVTLISDVCTLKLYVILAQILRIWNLSLKFNTAVCNLSLSSQPCRYKWKECNRCVQGRFLDSLPWAKLVNDIHLDTVQYKRGTLNGLNWVKLNNWIYSFT